MIKQILNVLKSFYAIFESGAPLKNNKVDLILDSKLYV